MRSDVDRAMQRARQYWYEDGLTEIAVGCLFLAVGLLFLVEATLPPGPAAVGLAALGLPIVVVGGALIARRVVAWAKAHLTYPRTGYVSYRRPPRRSRRASILVSAAFGILLAGLLSQAPSLLAWVPALEGVLIGAFWLYLAYSLGIVRFAVVALLSVLIGAATIALSLGVEAGTAAYFGGFGLVVIASGGLTLWTYLRRTHPAPEEGDDG